ncbi:200 kDa antigen p200, putative [Burkholderia pseudomallei 1710b]|uniref:200 kDa antigen p200, putative n=1 Tax=Burkholderia pseudomallei (strain 1710b) TaxID=320372 RepID=Q3JFS0_BURP1|nr:200 kDa antigen p200, putative [Burkholderia pseudomallei 1710b]
MTRSERPSGRAPRQQRRKPARAPESNAHAPADESAPATATRMSPGSEARARRRRRADRLPSCRRPRAPPNESAHRECDGRERRAGEERRRRAVVFPQPAGERARREHRDPAREIEHAERGAAQRGRRGLRDERGEHALRETHVQPPNGDAREQRRARRARAQQQIGRDQQQHAGRERRARAELVGHDADRIRGRRVRYAHHDHHGRDPCDVEPHLLRAQHEERLAEARERERGADQHDEPVATGKRAQRAPVQRRAERPRGGGRGRGLFDAEQDQRDRGERRHDREPQHRADVIGEREHQRDREQRPRERADGVHRLAQPEARAADLGRRDIGDERIARRAANALADAIEQPRGGDRRRPCRERKERLRQRGEPVAEQQQRLAPAQPIAERAGEDLDDHRGRLGRAFEHAERRDAHAHRRHEIDRQQRVDQLRRHIHAQADEAERPYGARNRRTGRGSGTCGHGQTLGERDGGRTRVRCAQAMRRSGVSKQCLEAIRRSRRIGATRHPHRRPARPDRSAAPGGARLIGQAGAHRVAAVAPAGLDRHDALDGRRRGVARGIEIGGQRLDRIAVLLPRVETALQRERMADALALKLADDALRGGFVRTHAINDDRPRHQIGMQRIRRIEIERIRARDPVRLLLAHRARPRVEHDGRRGRLEHRVELLRADADLREPAAKAHAHRPAVQQERDEDRGERVEQRAAARAHPLHQAHDLVMQRRAAEKPHARPERRARHVPEQEHPHGDGRRAEQRRGHEPQARQELREHEQRRAVLFEHLARDAQRRVERQREAHERVEEPPAARAAGEEPHRIGEHRRGHGRDEHARIGRLPHRRHRAADDQHRHGGHGHAELRDEHAGEHGPRTERCGNSLGKMPHETHLERDECRAGWHGRRGQPRRPPRRVRGVDRHPAF